MKVLFSSSPLIGYSLKFHPVTLTYSCTAFKQLLDEVFVISRIIKVEVGVISPSRRLRLIILTETLINWDITKTKSNNCSVIHWTKKMEVMFLLLHWRQAVTKQSMRTWHDYLWPWVSLTWSLYNLQIWLHRRWFRKFTVCFRPIRKEIVSSMYNNIWKYCSIAFIWMVTH